MHAICGLHDYHVCVMTQDQANGLAYAIGHLGDLSRALHKAYYAGYGRKVG